MENKPSQVVKEIKQKDKWVNTKFKRLPIGQKARPTAKLPKKVDELSKIKYAKKPQKLIEKKNLRKLPTNPAENFQGTLHLF